jgi:hypothetical protein
MEFSLVSRGIGRHVLSQSAEIPGVKVRLTIAPCVTPDLFRGPTLHNGILPLLHLGCRDEPGMTAKADRDQPSPPSA